MSLESPPKGDEQNNADENVDKKKSLGERLAEVREGKSAKDRMREVLHLDIAKASSYLLPVEEFNKELEKRKEFTATDADVELAYTTWKEVKDQLPADVTKYYADRVLRFAFHEMGGGELQLSENEIARALEVWGGVRDSVHPDLPKTYAMILVRRAFHAGEESYVLTETEKATAKNVLNSVSGYVSENFLEQYSRRLSTQ